MTAEGVTFFDMFGLTPVEAAEIEAKLYKKIVETEGEPNCIKELLNELKGNAKAYAAFRFGIIYTMSSVAAGEYDTLNFEIQRRLVLAQFMDEKALAKAFLKMMEETIESATKADNPPEIG